MQRAGTWMRALALASPAMMAAGAMTAGVILGGMLVAACAIVTATNLCPPSETFAWWARRTDRKQPFIT